MHGVGGRWWEGLSLLRNRHRYFVRVRWRFVEAERLVDCFCSSSVRVHIENKEAQILATYATGRLGALELTGFLGRFGRGLSLPIDDWLTLLDLGVAAEDGWLGAVLPALAS